MAYGVPNSSTSPTPETRLSSGTTVLLARFATYSLSKRGSFDSIVVMSRICGLVLSTFRPWRSTSCGSSGSTRLARLLTSTLAMSRLVPGSNTT